MLAVHVVLEVKRLLDEGQLSRRSIAKKLGVGRATVQAIANGKRGLHGREPTGDRLHPDAQMPPSRCPGCGKLVVLPCLYCRVQAYAMRRKRLADSQRPNGAGRAA